MLDGLPSKYDRDAHDMHFIVEYEYADEDGEIETICELQVVFISMRDGKVQWVKADVDKLDDVKDETVEKHFFLVTNGLFQEDIELKPVAKDEQYVWFEPI